MKLLLRCCCYSQAKAGQYTWQAQPAHKLGYCQQQASTGYANSMSDAPHRPRKAAACQRIFEVLNPQHDSWQYIQVNPASESRVKTAPCALLVFSVAAQHPAH